VEGSEEAVEVVVAVVVAVPLGDLPDAHQVVRRAAPDPEALPLPAVRVARVRQVVLGSEVPPHLVVDPAVHLRLARSLGSLDQMGYPLSLTVLVRVCVLAFWGGPALVGFVGLSFVGTAGGAVAMMGQSPVETIPLTRWSQPWQKERNWEPPVVVSPSGSKFVGLAGG
jgi:hypothetical protein